MKTIILFLTLAFITISANSQTKSSLIFSTAQDKYQKMETTGTILTAIGGVALFTGNILYWKVYNNPNQENPNAKAKKYGDISSLYCKEYIFILDRFVLFGNSAKQMK
jgi:hypothetical protein